MPRRSAILVREAILSTGVRMTNEQKFFAADCQQHAAWLWHRAQLLRQSGEELKAQHYLDLAAAKYRHARLYMQVQQEK